MSSAPDNNHAVVIGASVGGLVAAAALAPHYARVTVLERDRLPAAPEHRRGVPQSKHAHGLQPGGMRALETLLPGLTAELAAAGAPTGDVGVDCAWTFGGLRLARGVTGYSTVGITRPQLEYQVRHRVAALPGVTIRDDVVVDGLTWQGNRVTGVWLRDEHVPADLVLDATGKASKLPDWLAAMGFSRPAAETVRCHMAYLSQRWRLASPIRDVVTAIPPADSTHFGVMIAQEDGTHIVTLGGLLNSGPSPDNSLEFAAGLADPVIAQALEGAEPVTAPQPSHFPASRRYRYDKLRDFPAGLLALGDSIAAFNPMYGQGITVAALEAVELRTMLEQGSLQPRRYFRRAHRIEDAAWKISTGGDLRYDGVEGKRGPDVTIMNRYLDRLLRAAHTDPVLARQFLLVAGFLAAPTSLFRPGILGRVLVGGRKKRNRPVATCTHAGLSPIAP